MPVLTPVTLQMFPDGLGSFRSAVPVTSVGLQGFQISSSRGSVGLSTGVSRAISGQSTLLSQNVLGLNPSTSQSVNLTGLGATTTLGELSRIVSDSVQLTPLAVTLGAGSLTRWQLASGHYEPRESNMVIEHPRSDSETNSYAQHRWCYTGLAWNTRICVRDGSYPFFFEVDAISAGKGMYVGAQLSTVGDHLEAGATYARLHWDNPTAGTHTITVNVYDQEYQRGGNPSTVATVTWTLVVDTLSTKYVCVDPVNGNDTTGTGTIAAPFRTIQRIHNNSSSTTTFSNRQIILRAGTTQLDGMATNSNNYALQSGTNPVVFIGYPGETCTLELYEGWFVGRGAGDIMFKNVTIRHASEFSTKMHFYATVTGASRVSFHDCKLTNYFMGTSPGSENPALFYTTTGGQTSHMTIEGCEFTGQIGAIWTQYMTDGWTFQHNRVYDADTTGNTDGSNQWNLIYNKDSSLNGTFRGNKIYENNTLGTYGIIGPAGQNNGGLSHAFNNILVEYNFLQMCSDASIFMQNEYGGTPGSYFIRRNSCAGDIQQFLTNSVPTPYRITRNACSALTSIPGTATLTENLTGSGLFDADLKLTGSNRTNYLGTRGAEIA